MSIAHVTTECTGETAIGAAVTNAADRAAAVKTYDDTKYVAMGGTGVGGLFTVNTESISGSVDPRTKYLNFRMRCLAQTGLFVVQFFPDDSPNRSQLNIDIATLAPPVDGQFHDYSIQPTADWDHTNTNQGGCNPSMRVLWINGTPSSNDAYISYMSFGDAQTSTTDYPQAGAASVTMSGSAAKAAGRNQSGGASITMTGSADTDVTNVISGSASVTMAAASTQGYVSGGGTTLHTVDGPGTITSPDVHTVIFVPAQGQTVTHLIIDGEVVDPILTYTFPDDAADHIIVVTFGPAVNCATSYDLTGMNREDIGGPKSVSSHPEKNSANQPSPRGFVPQMRAFVPFPKDFI